MQERFVFDVLFTSHSALGARVLTRMPAQIFLGGGGPQVEIQSNAIEILSFSIYPGIFVLENKQIYESRETGFMIYYVSFLSITVPESFWLSSSPTFTPVLCRD